MSEFRQIQSYLVELTDCVVPSDLFNYLQENRGIFGISRRQIETILCSERNNGPISAASDLFNNVLPKRSGWLELLLRYLCDNGYEELARKISPHLYRGSGTHLMVEYNPIQSANQQSIQIDQSPNQELLQIEQGANQNQDTDPEHDCNQSDSAAAVAQAANRDSRDELPSYNIQSIPRGLCIIINNENFTHNPEDVRSEKLPDRPGTKRDEEKLHELFNSLGFEVRVLKNKTADGIEKCLMMCSKLSHDNKDVFVACILSHGEYGAIYGTDGHMVDIDRILSLFKADRCPTLAGKPKLFFLQACQGREKSKAATKLQVDGPFENSCEPPMEHISNEADFLVGYASTPGHVSFRHEDFGSWYISEFVEQMHKLCDKHDVLSIMTKVIQCVTERDADIDDGHVYKQCPQPSSTLRKQVFLPHVTVTR